MVEVWNFLITVFGGVIGLMKKIEIYPNVSLWSITVVISLLGSVIYAFVGTSQLERSVGRYEGDVMRQRMASDSQARSDARQVESRRYGADGVYRRAWQSSHGITRRR